ncbi:MAG: hypothetical protein V7K25_23585 [Nostoc sp.]
MANCVGVARLRHRHHLTLTEVSTGQYMYREQIWLNLEMEGDSSRQ